MNQYSKYYKILGLPDGASKKEVKRAFRKKAMLTHPDKNPNPSAKAKFIAINNAYEILTGQRSLPQQHKRTQAKGDHSNATKDSFKSDREKQREERREKMREAKRRKEEAYRRSPEFKLHLAIGTILDQIGYFVALLVLLTVPILFIANFYAGFLIGTLLFALTYPFWYRAFFTPHETINLKHFSIAFKYIFKNTNFRYYIFGVINLIALLFYTFNTFVPLYLVFLIMLTPTFYFLIRKNILNKKVTQKNWFNASSIGPLIVNLFFILNYTFSGPSHPEFHKVSNSYHRGSSFFMQLHHNAYSQYPGVRFFMISRDVNPSYIRLKMANGLFGFKIMKGYEFIGRPVNTPLYHEI